ncbi:MAG: uroporphyrinogen decarboxylase [Proteobacteria bacterium]|nr:uroporphyrinogen decarboxylase [Pseudomonadota bacterium]
MKTASNKPFLKVLAGEKVKTPPVWMMRQAGRYLPEYRKVRAKAGEFLDLCYNPKLASEVTLQPIDRFGFDAAIIFSDILVIPHALGMKLEYLEKTGPVLDPVRTRKAIESLSAKRFHAHLNPVYEALELTKSRLPKHTALIGFAGAPWTVATYMIEGKTSKQYEHTKQMMFGDKALFSKLMQLLVDVTSDYLIAQIDAGAEAVQLFDSWAGVLPEESFEEWVIKPAKEIRKRVKKIYPQVPFIGFPRGAGLYYKDFVKEVAPDAVGLDYTVPRQWAAEKLQTRLPVQGNLDPCILLTDKKTVAKETVKVLTDFKKGPHVFNLGHGILPATPIENVEAMIKAIRG